MSNNNFSDAVQAVSNVLDSFGVEKVIYVDDKNDGSLAVEEILGLVSGCDRTVLKTIFKELGDSIPDVDDVLSKKIRELWERLDDDKKRKNEIFRQLNESSPDNQNQDASDFLYISILNGLVPEGKLLNLTPEEWIEKKDALIEASKNQKFLFLFDRDFSDSPSSGDEEGGIKIIASLLEATESSSNLICGLLTHTVVPENMLEQWEKISSTHGIAKDRFVVIPKRHLNEAPMLFAQSLKFAALSPDFTNLKEMAKQIIVEATEKAAKQVDQINVFDLDHILFRVSENEGLWEPDMLFRLHAMFHRHESRQLAHANPELNDIAKQIRKISNIPTKNSRFHLQSSSWHLQRAELYEFDDHLNKTHAPIDLGDIFQRDSNGSLKYFILLAQPCDLMVRSKGEREPKLRRVSLLEIVCKPKSPSHAEELLYFDESPKKKWYVKFKAVHFVRVCLIDLCVFNRDGNASLTIGGIAPEQLRPAWAERHALLSSRFENLYKEKIVKYKSVVASLPGELTPVQTVFGDDIFSPKITLTNNVTTISYNCRRIGRLCRDRAMGLLMSYTSTFGRPAFDRDFGLNSND